MPKEQDFHLAFKRALADVSPRIVTLDETGSTNDDARALARAGAPHMTVVVADTQSAARLVPAWGSHAGGTICRDGVLLRSVTLKSRNLSPYPSFHTINAWPREP